MSDWRDPIHPGEILADELDEINLEPIKLASEIGVETRQIYQILAGKQSITADMALRVGQFFNTGPELWLNLQKAYELEMARQKIGNQRKSGPFRFLPLQPASLLRCTIFATLFWFSLF